MSDVAKPFEEAAGKTVKALSEDVSHAYGGILDETKSNLHTIADNVEENEKKTVRKYFVDDEGNVKEIVDGQLKDLSPEDDSGIRGLLDANRETPGVKSLTPEEKKELSANKKSWESLGRTQDKEGEWVESQKLEEPTDLSKAVEEARRAQHGGEGDYGGTNYAALHYASTDGKEEFILVGRSSAERSHSERSIGYPLVHNKKQFQVDQVYTERRPCQKGSTCERWLNMHMFDPEQNPDLKVTHAVDYDNDIKDTDVRNAPFDRYIDQLESNHASGDYGGTAGSMDFDVDPAAV
ncbi:nucleic acid/nucleotide deaminase domain-containing protein [Streptacidiphilus fuscans]|uniref:Nucleic acid/nucleotide deaminase of polymorphic system toxin n=1 Tax=Streptacidiphilus fuscans TaxID=2789292 RepID=A0A931B9G2_9ACTN|nr:nucleic acid/nucleotide deaminase domain-containing protein [Streptacidiphilus fuscans]MBF9071977.1 hypothetical protein [Streptacidiphilus fuscans]